MMNTALQSATITSAPVGMSIHKLNRADAVVPSGYTMDNYLGVMVNRNEYADNIVVAISRYADDGYLYAMVYNKWSSPLSFVVHYVTVFSKTISIDWT